MSDKTPNQYEIDSSRAKPPLEFDKIHPDLTQHLGTRSQNTTMAVGLIFVGIMGAGLASMVFDVKISMLLGAVCIVAAIVMLVQGGNQDHWRYATWIIETQKPEPEEIKVSPQKTDGSSVHYKATVKNGSGERAYDVEVLTSLPSHTESFVDKFVSARIFRDPSNKLAVVAELEDAENTRIWFSQIMPGA